MEIFTKKKIFIDIDDTPLEKVDNEWTMSLKITLCWQCIKYHDWNAAFYDIKKGTWCSQCVGCSKLNVDIVKGVALKRWYLSF